MTHVIVTVGRSPFGNTSWNETCTSSLLLQYKTTSRSSRLFWKRCWSWEFMPHSWIFLTSLHLMNDLWDLTFVFEVQLRQGWNTSGSCWVSAAYSSGMTSAEADKDAASVKQSPAGSARRQIHTWPRWQMASSISVAFSSTSPTSMRRWQVNQWVKSCSFWRNPSSVGL